MSNTPWPEAHTDFLYLHLLWSANRYSTTTTARNLAARLNRKFNLHGDEAYTKSSVNGKVDRLSTAERKRIEAKQRLFA